MDPSFCNHRLDIAYVGTRYHGWQIQPQVETIQGILERIISQMYDEKITLHGAGRTDAGVHAAGQVASFHAHRRISPDRLARALNSQLPTDIRIIRARLVDPVFHARKSAKSKLYHYDVYNGWDCSPFRMPFCHCFGYRLDIIAMEKAAAMLLGQHDFTSFCAHDPSEANHIRTITRGDIRRRGRLVSFRFEANGFLHHMIRNIVGTLLEVGRGAREAQDIAPLLKSRDRRLAGPTAPAQGLTLVKIVY